MGLIVSAAGLVYAPATCRSKQEPSNVNVTVGHGDRVAKYAATLLKKPDDITLFLNFSRTRRQPPHVTSPRALNSEIGGPS